MTPPIFNLYDEVIITGKPATLDTDEFLGKRFTIDTIGNRHGETVFSDAHLPWYPASSLRLVEEELKIGDYVSLPCTGMIKKIIQIDETDYPIQLDDRSWWKATNLRKLTPEEIAQHTGTIGYKTQEIRDEVESAVDAIRNLLAPDVYERLSAIEKRQDIQGDRLNTIDLEKDDLRKRLAFVEKFQRDQDDLIGRAMRDGVAEILDFRRKA